MDMGTKSSEFIPQRTATCFFYPGFPGNRVTGHFKDLLLSISFSSIGEILSCLNLVYTQGYAGKIWPKKIAKWTKCWLFFWTQWTKSKSP